MISYNKLQLAAHLNLKKPPVQKKTISYRKLSNINYESLLNDIQLSALGAQEPCDLEASVNLYNTVLTELLEKHAPLRTRKVSVHGKCPWWSAEIQKAVSQRRNAEKKWRRSKLEKDRQLFKLARNSCVKLIEQTKQSYYENLIQQCNGDQKKLYGVIQSLQQGKPKLKLPDCYLSTDLPQVFNNFFVKKIADIRAQLDATAKTHEISDASSLVTTPLCGFTPATESEIHKVVMLSKNCTTSSDPIPTWVLKKCVFPGSVLLTYITNIVNLSMELGQFPLYLKHALVKPLLKKPSLDQNVLKNYRPVSNLPFLSKILEKIVCNRLIEHININSLYEPLQSAYRKGHSTETALVKVHNDILMNLDSNRGVVLFLLDLSAAFDTIDHSQMIQRLENRIGIKATALEWFSSYLEGRTQAVYIEGHTSESISLHFGVPQGSILGPIEYSIYTFPVGDIIRKHNLQYHIYADDTQLYVAFDLSNQNSLVLATEKLKDCICEISQWMSNNRLKLNEDKTEAIIFKTPHSKGNICMDHILLTDASIRVSQRVRNIGATFDETLSMSDHISSVCKSANFHLTNIARIRKYITKDSCNILVHSLITSRLDYANATLYGLPARQLNRLQRILNNAARLVTLCAYDSHISDICCQLHWLPIKQRIDFKILLLTWKALNDSAPCYIQELLRPYNPSRTLRSSSDLLLTVPKTSHRTTGDRSFSYSAPKLWNNLPVEIRRMKELSKFKSAIKGHLFNEAYNQ